MVPRRNPRICVERGRDGLGGVSGAVDGGWDGVDCGEPVPHTRTDEEGGID